MDEHNITAENIWNFDEKGFLIGIGSKLRRIMSRGAYEAGKCGQSTQDGNLEFLTLIACVSALGERIPATLLYKGESRDPQDTWVEEFKEQDDLFFRATPNGWTNDSYGMKWLQEVFERRTRPRRATTKGVLIVLPSHSLAPEKMRCNAFRTL
jgi:hypothetical protein